jgi:hypothetical protein
MWRRVVQDWIGYRMRRLICPAPVWMAHLKAYSFAKGQLRYWWNR